MGRRPTQPRFRVEPTFEAEYPGASALATECVINMGFLASRFTAFLEAAIRREGVPSAAAFNVLTILDGAGEPLPPSTIAERMILTRGTITGIVDSLERHGLVRRLRHRGDARMRLVEITAEGQSHVRRIVPWLHDVERRWLDCLTAAEQRQLLRTVAALQANLPGEWDEVPPG